jgi:hypothetical protein
MNFVNRGLNALDDVQARLERCIVEGGKKVRVLAGCW